MVARKDKSEKAQAAPERDETTDTPVTELAHVEADTPLKDLKEMSGATDKDASTQQKDALEGLKQAKEQAKDPEKTPDINPHIQGPGGDIS